MKDSKHAILMLKLAQKDLKAVEGMINNDVSFSDEVFGFHAQQAVEKLVKAWLSFLGVKYSKSHDLYELFQLLSDNNVDIREESSLLSELTDFAVIYRYEDLSEISNELNRKSIFNNVKKFFLRIKKEIKNYGNNI